MFFHLLPKRGKHPVSHFTAAVTHYQKTGHTKVTPAAATALAAGLALLDHCSTTAFSESLELNHFSMHCNIYTIRKKDEKRFYLHSWKVTNIDKLNLLTWIQEKQLELSELCCRLYDEIQKGEDELNALTSAQLRNQP